MYNSDDILVGDKNAIFVAARILAYGKDYKVKFKDPSNNEDVEDTIDLSQIEPKEFDFEKYDRGSNMFSFELPFSKKNIHWSLLTHRDEQNIDAELKSMKKFSKNKNETTEVTTRLKYVIKAIDGDEDKSKIKSFVDRDLLARDSLAFREYIKDNTPDLDMTFNFESEDTGYTERMTIPLGVDLFLPFQPSIRFNFTKRYLTLPIIVKVDLRKMLCIIFRYTLDDFISRNWWMFVKRKMTKHKKHNQKQNQEQELRQNLLCLDQVCQVAERIGNLS